MSNEPVSLDDEQLAAVFWRWFMLDNNDGDGFELVGAQQAAVDDLKALVQMLRYEGFAVVRVGSP